MANVTLRLVKGTPLTNQEVDDSFSNLNIFKTEIGGDLGGNVFFPTVIGLQGRSVSNAEPSNAQVLSWSVASNAWIAANAVASYVELSSKPAVNVTITGDLTGASNVVLANTNTNNLAINVSYDYDNLDSRFLKLANPTTQIVTSYIEFQGNVIFAGNVTTIAANNLLIEDNFIYLNANNFSSNEDLGLAGNYNDGIYAHTGIFRDASDNGTWKIFEGYLPEVSAAINIDTDNASFRLANLAINALTANTIKGIVSTAVVTNLNADLLDGQQGTYYLNYDNLTSKPAANIVLSGDIAGSANAVLTATSTVISITTTIQPNSVVLGTDTTGNYTDRVLPGTGLSATGTADEGNVITLGLTNTGVVASSYGNAKIIPVITVDAQGRITSASNAAIQPDVANIVLTGDVSGSANAILSPNATIISIATTIQPNSVALGTDTTGNYVASLLPGTAISLDGTTSENNLVTVNHADTSTVANVTSDNSNGVVIQDITLGFDGLGHVTSATVATANLDSRFLGLTAKAADADLLDGENSSYYLSYVNQTQKPAANIILTGDVSGSANAVLTANSTVLSVNVTIQANSVTLGTDTTGDYTTRILPGSAITVTGTADEGNVITVNHANTSTVGNVTSDNSAGIVLQDITLGFDTFGHVTAATVATANLDTRYLGLTAKAADSDLLDGQDSTHYLNYNNLVNKPAANIILSGDVSGSANVILTANSAVIAISTTIAANSVALGTDTTGNYVANVEAGSGLIASGGGSENATVTVSHANTSSVANVTSDNAGGVVIQDITLGFDTFGHVTAASVATANLDTRYLGITSKAADSDLLDGQDSTHYLNYNNLVNKPAANIILSGDVSGSANVILTANSAVIAISTTIQPDSVALGTDTTGNYVANVEAGVGLIASGGGSETSVVTVSHANTSSVANVTSDNAGGVVIQDVTLGFDTFGHVTSATVATANLDTRYLGITSKAADSDQLDGQDGTYYLDWTNTTNKPDPVVNVTLTGDVTGSASAILTDVTSNTITISTTIAANSVALGTDTTGNYTDRVVAGTGITATGTADEGNVITVGLTNTGVVANTYGNATIIPVITVDAQGRITSASNVAINIPASTTNYNDLTNKPAANIILSGDVAGSANVVLTSNTTVIAITTTVQPNSVALGTDTTGNYTDRVIAGIGITATGTADEGNVITIGLSNTSVTASSYGNATIVPVFTVDAQGRITAASNVAISAGVSNYNDLTNKPAANIILSGDVTGSANVILTANSAVIAISTTIAANSVALGTDTTGNYVANVEAGVGLIASGGGSETSVVTVSHANTSSVANVTSDNAGGVVIQDITLGFDTFGHVTAATVATANLDTRYLGISSKAADSELLDGQDSTHYLNYNNLVNKPAANILLTGDVAGSANVILTANSAVIAISTTIQPDSVALGTDTTGQYLANLVQGSGITLSGLTGEGATPTISANVTSVGSFTGAVSNTNLLSSILQVDGSGSGLDADLLDGEQGSYYLDWNNTTNKPDPVVNVTLTGDVTGSASATLADVTSNTITIATTIAANSVVLGTDTTGNYTDRVVAGTGISASGTGDEGNVITVGLTNTGVVATTYGNATIVPVITVDAQGRITSASNVAISAGVSNYNDLTNKPAANIILSGDVAGSANVVLTSNSTVIAITTTVQPNSVALGTDTTGNYTDRVIAGTGISASGTGDEGNVITVGLTNTGVVATTYGNATIVPVITVDAQGRITAASNVAISAGVSNYNDLTNKPAANIILSGDVTGSANVVLTSNSTVIAITTSIEPNSVALGTDTTGNYVANVEAGSGLIASGGGSENATVTVSHADTSSVGNVTSDNSGGVVLQDITLGFDTFGHVTAASVATANLDTRYLGITSKAADAELLDGQDSTHYLNYVNQVNKPAANIILSGDVTGSANAVLSVNTTILGITSTLANTAVTPATYGNATIIPVITVDSKGRITSAANVAISAGGGGGGGATLTSANNFIVIAGTCSIAATGCNNIFIGANTGASTTFGCYNFFAGRCAGLCNTTGSYNNFFGDSAGCRNTNGCNNNFFGRCAGRSNTTGNYNNFFGRWAGCYNTTGNCNNFFGDQAGYYNTTGSNNNFIGSRAGYYNTTGSDNNFIGRCAGFFNTDGSFNNFFGLSAGCSNSTGCNNNFFGSCAGRSNTTGCNNNFFGSSAGLCSTTGNYNNFMGLNAGRSNTTGNFNNFIGSGAGRSNTTGSNNNFFGSNAGFNNTTGNYNNFFGKEAGYNNTSGYGNNFFGPTAGFYNTTGSNNNFFGYQAGFYNTTGCYNTFIGRDAGRYNTTGNYNNFFGSCAGCGNTTGCFNNFFGASAGRYNTTGCNNNFIGSCAGCSNTTGSFNNFIGSGAGRSNTTGRLNNFFGPNAGLCNTTGSYNNFFGSSAGCRNTTGSDNNFIGRYAGRSNTTGCNNNFIGSCAGCGNTTGSFNNFIGRYAGRCNTTGSNNNFFGLSAGLCNTTGSDNNFIGRYAGRCNTTGCNNNFIGLSAGCSNTSGNFNNFFGRYAGCRNTTGCNNNFIGLNAGFNNTTGSNNNFFGPNAGTCNTTGSNNNFIGPNAGLCNTTGSDNNFFGQCAGFCNTTFSNNVFIGACAGRCNNAAIHTIAIGLNAGGCGTGGFNNVFLGCFAGACNTTGNYNTFIGRCAGCRNSFGSNNIFMGRYAGCVNTTGSRNIFLGLQAGISNSTGVDNIFMGERAGVSNTSGCNNVFFGKCSGHTNTTGRYNIFIGQYTGFCNTIGSFNFFAGLCAGYCNTATGCNNIFIGNQAGFRNTTGGCNFFAGLCAGYCNTTGNNNFIAGFCAGFCNTTGRNNIFIGSLAGRFNTVGTDNIFLGDSSGTNNNTGCNNTFVGAQAGLGNTTGGNNNFLGSSSGRSNTGGAHNNFMGANSGRTNTTGSYNNFLGFCAGCCNTTGCNNNFFGCRAGFFNSTGNYNIFAGLCAGCCNTTGSNNIFFGCIAGVGAAGLCNVTTESNHIIMGNSSHTQALIQIAWTAVSDARDKCIFGPVPHGRRFLNKVNPIAFAFKDRNSHQITDPPGKKRYGFSAQEIAELEGSDVVISNKDNPDKYFLTSDYLVPVLVNAIKELSAELETVKKRLDALENK